MNIITQDSLANVEFKLDWKSDQASHTDTFFTHVNFWRDTLPGGLADQLIGSKPGQKYDITLQPGKDMPVFDPKKEKTLKRTQFNSRSVQPRYGRFYPQGLLSGLTNVFPDNIKPFRCVGIENGSIMADFNHPLSSKELHLSASVHDTMIKPYDRGGECAFLIECITDGPGMQKRFNGAPTDFFSEDAFDRSDKNEDSLFYQEPRMVNHLDAKAIETVTGIYEKLLEPGQDVLDLMSSWRSHVPESIHLNSLFGLGMNGKEMAENPQLTDYVVHDLNVKPHLPFADDSFDRVLCNVSVEYMTRPLEVFDEVARILRKNGIFVLTFSNRWFPPKVIKIWTELHEFERMGLVLEYFARSGLYGDLNTFSSRGWPRPEDDKYYPEMRKSDPVYAVWGRVN